MDIWRKYVVFRSSLRKLELGDRKSLHFDSKIFGSEDHDIVGAISKPSAWPPIKFYSIKLISMFQDFLDW